MAVSDVLANMVRRTLDYGLTLWPGKGTVTVTQRDPDDQSVLDTVSVAAIWRDEQAQTVPSEGGGEVRIETRHWRFPAELFTDFEPRKFDTVTDADGVVWTIESVRKVVLDGWRYTVESVRILGG